MGKIFKGIVNDCIKDDDIVCLGEQGDKLGRYDRKIIGVETRSIGFDSTDVYKVITSLPYESHGNLKFWNDK